jgi:hypothetical protein
MPTIGLNNVSQFGTKYDGLQVFVLVCMADCAPGGANVVTCSFKSTICNSVVL